MRSWDQGKPKSGLTLRLEQLQNAQLFQTVRGLSPENHRAKITFTTDAISDSLRLSDNSSKVNLAKANRIDVLCRQR